ncbi:uncharacterized protein F5147DRAFT_724486 [Suillus discolor]|uniref:Uncharacterized protein n=1 Tax=Suillus discolor TaxID=1912936 RepID=A0A9P7JN64_9AGAM|nr:uncharacterized protein F5147DRAFT_724486 [Suillus discolor]KAG2090776.1 hypothetical protein F5147DRAFT_724486 [Suillus discolor]
MSSVLEGILYGFSVLMFLGTIWIITYKRRTCDVNRPAVVVATLMFLLSTVRCDTFPGGPAAFFADISEEMFVVKDTILVLQTMLGDGAVIYRCYIVWQSVWIIIIPCMMRCGIAVFGVVTLYDFSQASSNNVFTNKTGHLVATFMTKLTLATNLLSLGLLAYRIWKSERKVFRIRATKRKMPLLRVFIDAAILYPAALCSSIICFILANNGLYVMADLVIWLLTFVVDITKLRSTRMS